MLAGKDLSNVAADPEVWEKVLRKLHLGAMPPAGVPRPDEPALLGLVTWLETGLDRAAAATPRPGRPLPHRMNRAEYANAIRDLLAVDVGDVATLLPADESAYGFDNIADALGFSTLLTERYVAAAGRIAAMAVGDLDVAVGSETYMVRQDLSQDQHIEGQPFGTIGGVIVRHTFPVDGEYTLSATLMRTNVDQPRGLEYPYQLEFTVDGERVFITTVGGGTVGGLGGEGSKGAAEVDRRLAAKVPVTAGPHEVGVAFLQRSLVQNTRKLQPYRSSFDTFDATGLPHVRSLAVTGPFAISGSGDTPSRRRIFVCRPATAADELPCATRIIKGLALRAYRRPPDADDLKVLMDFYQTARQNAGFEVGIERALQRMLASPQFVLRLEHEPARLAAGAAYRLNDYDLASRLSFFLWSTIPDDQLLELAGQGRLRTPAVLEQQVRRMLLDPRSAALATNFAGQWLQLRNLKNAVPDAEIFPEFDDNLRQAFRRESELLFDSIVREDRDVRDLLTADYTFVNERLARHYNIPNVSGDRFRRVARDRRGAQGALRARWHSHPHVQCRPDVARVARQVDSHEPARHGAVAAAGQRSASQDQRRADQAADHARADGRAPRQSGVCQLPQAHGSARLHARELRRGRRLADGGRGRARGCLGPIPRRDAGQRGPRAAPGRATAPRGLCGHPDREAADLRGGPGPGVFRHAGRPEDRPGRGPE